MKKIGVLLVLFLVLFSLAFVSAASNETDAKAIACLKTKLGSNCGNSNSVEQLSFSLLAMSDDSSLASSCKSSLKSKMSSSNCFPSSSCTIKETSLALYALNTVNDNTDKIEAWLSSHNRTTDLEWYLEIDSSEATSCTINYDSADHTISIAENKKISGNPGSCLTLAYDNYWLKINADCLAKEFSVSCDKSFISTLLYKKPSSNVWYVSSDVQSSAPTKHKVSSLCLGMNSCDYEATLLGVLALQKAGVDINIYLPYLIAYSQDNTKYSSYSLLYFITNSNDYLSETINQQKSQGYWDLSSSQGKFYDTALALLAVSDAPETKAKNWLTQNQGSDGCWNSGNIRDTAILIWGGWPRTPIATTSAASCSDAPGFCMSSGECYDASGKVLANFACSGVQVCCDKQLVEKTCSEKSGIVCTSGKQCSSTEVSASDTSSCCLGTCVEPVTTTECEQNSYNCRASCLDEEEESTLSCESSKICCKPSTITSGGGSLWWLWILIILIILVVLAIIFRKRIQVWWFNRKNKGSESKVQASRPGFPPFSQLRPMMPRPQPSRPPAVRPAPRPVSRPQVKSKTDSELEATLRKLREMSK